MKTIKKICKGVFLFLFFYFLLAFLTPFNSFLHNRSIENQIHYLLSNKNFDFELQLKYPEGFVFFNSILALSIIEFSESSEKSVGYAAVVDELVVKLLSDSSADIFTLHQKLPNGAFYNGWVNFTLKNYLNSGLIEYSEFQNEFTQAYDSLSNEIIQSQHRQLTILESYPNSYWPADNLACIASLPNEQKELKRIWVELLKSTSKAKLIHHDDMNLSKVRGSSQSLITFLLSSIDENFARMEYDKFSKDFITPILGVNFVIEDLSDRKFEDIDSGPVLLGYGSVATIMNAKASKAIGKRSKITEGFLNALGVPLNFNGNKYYIFKQEAMFDVFMLWIQV